jgi:hypothetical protein
LILVQWDTGKYSLSWGMKHQGLISIDLYLNIFISLIINQDNYPGRQSS